jgi:hypothetical protein
VLRHPREHASRHRYTDRDSSKGDDEVIVVKKQK